MNFKKIPQIPPRSRATAAPIRMHVPDERQRFWLWKSTWPQNPAGYVFLAEAFHEVGRAKYGDEWLGCEPYLRSDTPTGTATLSHILKKDQSERTEADRAAIARQIANVKERIENPEEFDAKQRQIAEQTQQERLILGSRAFAVQEQIIAWCESGELSSAIRPIEGGAMTPLKRELWNGANPSYRFYLCQMSVRNPFSRGVSGKNFGYIFIENQSLQRLLAQQPFSRQAAEIDVHLSPYLKVMLHVIRSWQIDPENQFTKDAIEAAMKEAWTGPHKLSDRLAQAMASLVREPESQAGKALRKKTIKGVTLKKQQ